MSSAPHLDLADLSVDVIDRILHVRISRPTARNAIRSVTLDDLEAVLAWASSSGELGGLVLSGEGTVFSAGADLKEMRAADAEALRAFVHRGALLFRALSELVVPTAAVIDGTAVGGGLELALACDERHVVEGSRLGLPEVVLGHLPGWGAVERLPGLIGSGPALELSGGGRLVDTGWALEHGLITAVHPDRAAALAAAADRARDRPRGAQIVALKRARSAQIFGDGTASAIVLDGIVDGMLRARGLDQEEVTAR